ncbi:tRNA 2'-phosphotransferase 1 isoform X2 [Gracilinanus agilis]|uniref:tRNA 2'-phosphotransferase 1 isoform X2 n=1 Tax=Gracilinanus agilis TaxID=191870 RepID=UPI001CFDF763|nr:tRNA 2'-phosphotransferase 1 isoform X2 [Gracilinanus agilis]
MNPAGGQTSQQAGPWGRRTRRPSAQVRAQGSSVGAGGPPRSSAGAVGPSAGDGGAGDAPPPGAGDFPGNSGLERDQHPRVLGLFQERDVRLSKALSYALRHGAVKMGLPMGSDGFVPLDALLQLPQFRGFSEEDVCRVVETNEKQRFALRPGAPGACACIRANQGHSLQLADLELTPLRTPQDLPPVLVHGTYWRHWPSIRQEGLSRCGRTHIHLSPGLPGEPHVLSGMRQNCEVAVFIDGPSALAEGILFFRSANGVILTPGDARGFLPPKYFKEALQLGSPRRPLSLAEEETEGQSGPQGASANSRRKNIRSVQP